MKILNCCSVFFSVPIFFDNQIGYFTSKGYAIHLVCSPTNGKLEKYAKSQNCNFKEIDISRNFSIFRDLYALYLLIKLIHKERFNVISGHSPKGALLSILAGFICRTNKRIYFRHGLVFETSTGLKKQILIAADKLTARLSTIIVNVSPSVHAKSQLLNLNQKKRTLILNKGTCNGIDLQKFHLDRVDQNLLSELKEKFDLNNNQVIGFVGRLVKDKGVEELVEAFLRLNQKNPKTKLLIIGVFEVNDRISDKTEKLIQNHSNIIHINNIQHINIHNYYALMDVFVLPSYREGFPTVILEASSMKLPVITTKNTGCIDSIVENSTGVFTALNSEDINDKLQELLTDPKRMKKLGSNGRVFIEKNFDQFIIWSLIEKLYNL